VDITKPCRQRNKKTSETTLSAQVEGDPENKSNTSASIMSAKRKHNKSGSNSLSLLASSNETIKTWHQAMSRFLIKSSGLIENSDCLLLKAGDGRFSYLQKKVAFGYQIVAFQKFGRDQLSKIASNKTCDDLLISHLCGTRNCCEPSHLVIESKATNDERTHCHFCLRNTKQVNGFNGVKTFLASGACNHVPLCCSINV